MSKAESQCPQSFCGFSFHEVREWLVLADSLQPDDRLEATAITHNEDVIYLQFNGWSINLYDDGSYAVEVTEGG